MIAAFQEFFLFVFGPLVAHILAVMIAAAIVLAVYFSMSNAFRGWA